MTAIDIRRVTPDEWKALRALHLRALAADPDAFERTLDQAEALPDSHWRDAAIDGTTDSRSVSIAAWSGEIPIAMASGIGREGDDRVQLAGMWVDPAHRRSGLATALVRAVITWAADLGDGAVYLWVAAGNNPAERLYESLGFEYDGTAKPLAGHPGVTERRMVLSRGSPTCPPRP